MLTHLKITNLNAIDDEKSRPLFLVSLTNKKGQIREYKKQALRSFYMFS